MSGSCWTGGDLKQPNKPPLLLLVLLLPLLPGLLLACRAEARTCDNRRRVACKGCGCRASKQRRAGLASS
jgi:hypothetical protein